MDSGYRSAAQDLALILAQEMFGRLVEAVVSLLPHHLHYHTPQQAGASQSFSGADPQRLFMPQLAHFIPAVKVRI